MLGSKFKRIDIYYILHALLTKFVNDNLKIRVFMEGFHPDLTWRICKKIIPFEFDGFMRRLFQKIFLCLAIVETILLAF